MGKLINKLVPKIYGFYINTLALFSKKRAAKKTLEVFATVRKGKVLPQQREFLEKAKDQVVRAHEHDLQTYKWPGKKDTVLLVHGWESNSFRWRNLLEKLQEENYEIIAFDAPGHGYSSGKYLPLTLFADCIQKVIEVYNPKYLVGHSFGGMAILLDEYNHRNAFVEKIITIGSPSEFRELLTQYQNLVGFNHRVLQAFEAYVIEKFGIPVDDFSSSRFVKNNTKKGLLLHDELDKLAPFHASEKVHAHWVGSTFIRTKGLGHSMHQAHINDQIIEFLKA